MRTCVLSAVVVLALAVTASANLLQNPGFEMTTNGDYGAGWATNWTRGNDWGISRQNWGSPSQRPGSTNDIWWESWRDGGWGWMNQNVYTNAVVGDVATFTIWGCVEQGFSSSASEAYMTIEFWTNDANKSFEKRWDFYSTLMANRGAGWQQYTLVATNTALGVTLVKPLLGSGQWSTNYGGTSFAVVWDDADLTIVPEPTIAALLGFGGLLFLAVRRVARK